MSKYLQIILLFSYFVIKCSTIDQILDSKLITTKTFVFWPNATVPFYINPDHFDHEQAMAIMTALSMFAFKTCLKFAPVMTSPDENQHVMTFVNPDGVRRCKINMKGHLNFQPHLVVLGYECLQSPEIDMIIMRALGFPFEHNRMSRDVYIDVKIENVDTSSVELFTKDTVLPPALRALPYDINSVMHFGEREHSKNGHRTIIFKNHNIRQHRLGLSAIDLRKIELVYGPECRNRDRQEKIELCQSYPGVARRKREVILEPPANISLRVNRDITAPPSIVTAVVETQPLAEHVEEKQDAEFLTESLTALGIANETEEIIEQVYKLSALALKNAREKYCNVTSNSSSGFESTTEKSEKRKRGNSSDLLGILEVIADYAKSMVDNAVRNLTAFCQDSESIEAYQRQCSWDFGNNRCPKTYRSTKSGPVRYSTNHRPVYKQPTRHVGGGDKYSYDRARRSANDTKGTTHSISLKRRKRAVTEAVATPKPSEGVKEKNPQKEKKNLKEKEKSIQKEKLEVGKENSTTKLKMTMTTTEAKNKETSKGDPRRFFQERRYKVKEPQDDSEMNWEEESNVSLDKEKQSAKEEKEDKKDQEIDDDRDKEREEEDQKDKEIEIEAEKIIDKEELVKEVLSEGLGKIIDKTIGGRSSDKTVESKESTEDKDSEGEKNIEPEKELKKIEEKEKIVESEKELSLEPDVKETEKTAEETDIETTTQKGKRHKIKADKQILDMEVEKTKEKEVRLNKNARDHMKKRKRSQTSQSSQLSQSNLPKTVKLNKLNEEFYNERRWPDGVVRYVIKRIPEYDLEDLRNRLAEVNSILTRRTCVRLQEVDSQEADGYEDSLVLDTSPDYVTGRVGGKQIFGCVELFRGGQHKQHTAMMVMAMLGFYFEVSRHDRDRHIRVHMRHVRPDKLHHFEKIRDEATLDLPYDYQSATHPAWQFWRKIGKTGISTVATYKEQDPDGSVMRSLGQNAMLLSESDIIKINSVYGINCFQNKRASEKVKAKRNRLREMQ